jgi:protein-tyrosine-phosphatase
MRVLVVCHANVARSVAAAYLLAEEDGEGRLEVRAAGTHALEGQPVSSRTSHALAEVLGRPVDLRAFRSHQLSQDDVEWADVIVTMEGSQVRLLRRTYPSAAPKVATLAHYARHLARDRRPIAQRIAALDLGALEVGDDDDVLDPAGGDAHDYESSMTSLVALCAALSDRL